MTAIAWICGVALAASALVTLVVIIRSRSVGDRAVGIDVLVSIATCAAAVGAVVSGDGIFSEVVVVLTLVGFIGAVAAGRFIDRRGL